MATIGLLFGTFDPIHNGHLHIAQAAYEQAPNTHPPLPLSAIWFVLTPQSPHKTNNPPLFSCDQRLSLLKKALHPFDYLKPCTIELDLPAPQYTYHTLNKLTQANPKQSFALIMGADQYHGLNNWRNGQAILNKYPLFVYHRDIPLSSSQVHALDGALVPISSTKIRKRLAVNQSIQGLVPPSVEKLLHQLYKPMH